MYILVGSILHKTLCAHLWLCKLNDIVADIVEQCEGVRHQTRLLGAPHLVLQHNQHLQHLQHTINTQSMQSTHSHFSHICHLQKVCSQDCKVKVTFHIAQYAVLRTEWTEAIWNEQTWPRCEMVTREFEPGILILWVQRPIKPKNYYITIILTF